ncbi:MAG: SPOR domain-containing protein [Cyclonatronaceae bacterium]
MSLKAIAVFCLLPVVIVMLTSCGPTESERHKSEIARQDSLARIRADSIAMAFNQNIDQAQDIRSLMDNTRRPADEAPANAGSEPEETVPASGQPEKTEQPAASATEIRQSDPEPAPQAAAGPERSATETRETAQTAPSSQTRTTGTAAAAISVADELAPSVAGGRYTVQLGTWRNEDLAKAEIEQLREWGFSNTRLIRMEVNQQDGLFYVIRMGRYDGFATARQQANYLNMEFGKNAVVIDLNPSM